MPAIGWPRRQAEPWHAGQRRVIQRGQVRPACLPARQHGELGPADGRLDVGDVRLEAGLGHVVPPAAAGQVPSPRIAAEAVQACRTHVRGQLIVVGGDRAAFADRKVLGRVEAEARRAGAAAKLAPPQFGAEPVRGVLNHRAGRKAGGGG